MRLGKYELYARLFLSVETDSSDHALASVEGAFLDISKHHFVSRLWTYRFPTLESSILPKNLSHELNALDFLSHHIHHYTVFQVYCLAS